MRLCGLISGGSGRSKTATSWWVAELASRVVKNKVAPPFREAEFDVMYGEGISKEGDLLDLAVDRKIVEKSGTWFAFGGERLGQGRENVKQFLKDNPTIFKSIEEKVRRELGLVRDAEVAAAV